VQGLFLKEEATGNKSKSDAKPDAAKPDPAKADTAKAAPGAAAKPQ
jgi:hypothetical protein